MAQNKKGFIEIAMLGVMLFFAAAILALNFSQELRKTREYMSQANAIMVINTAAQAYVTANKTVFQSGKTLMYVNDQNAPTIEELRNLGFLSRTAGADADTPFGSNYAVKIELQPNNSITGFVYLTSSILNKSGQPDQMRACGIARALGDSGVCTSPQNAAVLQNRTTMIPNPSGQSAVVASLIYVAP